MNKHLTQKGHLIDRGKTKWSSSFMLTEHVQMLREWQNEDNIINRPQLDEFDLQLIGEEMELAYKRKCDVRIQTWKDGCIKECRGRIIEIKPKYLVCYHSFGNSQIQFDEIISLESLV